MELSNTDFSTIQESWDSFAGSIPAEVPESLTNIIKKAVYAGAFSMYMKFEHLVDIASDINDVEFEKAWSLWLAELEMEQRNQDGEKLNG